MNVTCLLIARLYDVLNVYYKISLFLLKYFARENRSELVHRTFRTLHNGSVHFDKFESRISSYMK